MKLAPIPGPIGPGDIDSGVVATVMELTEPELWNPASGETLDDRAAREAARADIVADLLSEIRDEHDTSVDCDDAAWRWAA